jgi:hypothetical protein
MRPALALVFFVSGSLGAAEPEKQYVVFPVRTELQRELYGPNSRFHIVLHGNALFDKDGKLDTAALPVDDLQADIRVSRHPKDTLSVGTEYYKSSAPAHARRLLEVTMKGLALEEGYPEINYYGSINPSDAWKALMARTKGDRGTIDEDGVEDAVENQTVRAYPIRTVFSRWRLDDSDCYVAFKAPLGKDFDGIITPQMAKHVKVALDKLALKARGQIHLAIRHQPDSDVKLTRRFCFETGPAFAKTLGFAKCIVSEGTDWPTADKQGK